MIGLRPYLLLVLAVAVLVVVGLDAGRHAGACSPANALIGAREYSAARTSYSSVLAGDDHSGCAKAGLARATDGECVDAERIAVTDPSDARHQLLTLAASGPPPGPRSCVWGELARLAPASTTTAAEP
jgi:hypothetical protein